VRRLLFSIVLCSIAAFAADISGNWKATADGPNGAMERTFTFKVDGAKVTGETTSTFVGKSTIADGKIDGDNITFTITADMQGNELKISYKGKINGKEMTLTSEVAGGAGGGQPIEWKAKKVE
jgi:hypothetical protein